MSDLLAALDDLDVKIGNAAGIRDRTCERARQALRAVRRDIAADLREFQDRQSEPAIQAAGQGEPLFGEAPCSAP